jgi:CxxC motif-containing protein
LRYDTVKAKILSLDGASCRKGEEYATQEVLAPMRTLTTTLKVSGGDAPLVSVRSAVPMPKEHVRTAAAYLRTMELTAPVRFGETVAVLPELGTEMIATADCLKKTVAYLGEIC